MTRRDMEGALKLHCVPYLRNLGFKGSFPDLYREANGLVSLLNFQFYSSGGSVCVNISYGGRNGENIYFRKDAEPRHVRLAHTRVRARLGAENLIGDKWTDQSTENAMNAVIKITVMLMLAQSFGDAVLAAGPIKIRRRQLR